MKIESKPVLIKWESNNFLSEQLEDVLWNMTWERSDIPKEGTFKLTLEIV